MIWGVFALGLALTLLGSMAGAALVYVSRAELGRAVSRQLRGGSSALAWLSRIESILTAAAATTAFGVILLGATFPAVFARQGAVLLAPLIALVAVPFVLFSGYLAPRWLTASRADRVTNLAMPLLEPWARVLSVLLPARRPSRATEFRTLWREGAAVGLRADEDLRTVGGVMAFASRPVREIMTPRTDLIAIPEDATLPDITQVFAHSGYSRIPVYRGTLDEIVGMLHAFDLFKLRPGDPLPVRPVAIAAPGRAAGELFLDMQRERRHLAVVLDEFGGTLGLISLEDLLEELVGEIYDEHDQVPVRLPVAGSAALADVDGSTPTAELALQFDMPLPKSGASTIGGLLAELAGRIPAAGERFVIGGLEVDVVTASATRVERLLVRPGPVALVPLAREPS
ncbi:MAG: HlyC/CorC family transporter [Gemmatimonadales bacterium]|nr:MAG: HlyC/CorC family transporter [Gemmatimonadales bacterium]